MKTVVVIPTYNEKDNVENLISKIMAADSNIHVLIVDDRSPDGTGQIVERHPLYERRVFLIKKTGPRGRGLADFVGLQHALAKGYDYILQMDADFSHQPKYIPQFLEAIKRHDVVIGSRQIAGGAIIGRPWWRNALTKLANVYIRCLMGFQVKDWTSGYRCYRRDVLAAIDLDRMISVNPSSLEEILYACVKRRYDIHEIPITFIDRRGGRSKVNLGLFLKVFLTILKIRFRK